MSKKLTRYINSSLRDRVRSSEDTVYLVNLRKIIYQRSNDMSEDSKRKLDKAIVERLKQLCPPQVKAY